MLATKMILACALVAVALGDGRGVSSPRPSKPVNAGKAQANQASNEATPAAAVMKAAAGTLHSGPGRTAADDAAACVIGDVHFHFLANNKIDYVAPSTFYQSYEFVFNVCRDLVWSEGECAKGSSVCERLLHTHTATDVYGNQSTQTSGTNDVGRYFEYAGGACLFGTGQKMTSRVYLACDEKQAAEVIYESFYDCAVHIKLSDPRVCQNFICIEGACKGAVEGGVPKEQCEKLCAPEPPKPMFACKAGKCVRATGTEKGVPLDVCQKGCRAEV